MTANDIYEAAIALIDEINPDTGLVSVDTTDDYKARAPYLIDILQKELAKTSKYEKLYEFEYTPSDKEWVKIDLPSDFDTISKITIDGNPSQRISYQLENKSIYIKYSDAATFNILYNAIPPTVTSLDDELVLTDLSAMPYGLAKKFVEVEQNDFLVGIFSKEYDRQRIISAAKSPASIEKMINVYGGI
jgi:hypothetical protein